MIPPPRIEYCETGDRPTAKGTSLGAWRTDGGVYGTVFIMEPGDESRFGGGARCFKPPCGSILMRIKLSGDYFYDYLVIEHGPDGWRKIAETAGYRMGRFIGQFKECDADTLMSGGVVQMQKGRES